MPRKQPLEQHCAGGVQARHAAAAKGGPTERPAAAPAGAHQFAWLTLATSCRTAARLRGQAAR